MSTGRRCIRREGTSEAAPEAVRQAVGGGCQSGWGRLLSVTNAVELGTCGQGDTGWASSRGWGWGWPPPFECIPRGRGGRACHGCDCPRCTSHSCTDGCRAPVTTATRMSKGERPIGAAKGKQTSAMASCQHPQGRLLSRGGGGFGIQKIVYQKQPNQIFHIVNSVAFGSAPRRKADSQPANQSVSQASGQSDSQSGKQAGKQKHSVWVFFSGRLGFKQWGGQILSEQATVEWQCSRPHTCRSAVQIPVSRPPTFQLCPI